MFAATCYALKAFLKHIVYVCIRKINQQERTAKQHSCWFFMLGRMNTLCEYPWCRSQFWVKVLNSERSF